MACNGRFFKCEIFSRNSHTKEDSFFEDLQEQKTSKFFELFPLSIRIHMYLIGRMKQCPSLEIFAHT